MHNGGAEAAAAMSRGCARGGRGAAGGEQNARDMLYTAKWK